MQPNELINRLEDILDHSRTGVLATTDSQGQCHMRWMTPALLSFRPREIFAFSVPDTAKIEHINDNHSVQWMIQSRDLREIVTLECTANVIDNPSIKTELMEVLGKRLAVFWKANVDKDEFVVVESAIKSATYFLPMHGTRKHVTFG